MGSNIGYGLAAPLFAALLAACAHNHGESSTTTTTGAALQNDTAIDVLAQARCERESECNDIGNGPFSTKDECRDAVRQEMQDELSDYACPRGIDKGQLDRCVAEIRDITCHNPMGPLADFPECKPGKLCARYDMR